MAHFFQWQRKDTIEYGLKVFQFELILGLKIKKSNFYFFKKMKESRTLFEVLSLIIVLGEVYHFYG